MRVLSVFTGAGGLDMAVSALWPDHQLVAFSEVDKHAAACFQAHHPNVPNLGDITDIDWHDVPPVDVIVGGFPCQDISHAGKGEGIKEGTRSGLWFRMADAVRILRPRLVLLENVAAITAPGRGFDHVLAELAARGFDAEWGVLRAADVGACHGRARWFCAAYPDSKGLEGRQPEVVRERGRQGVVGEGDTPPDLRLLATPQARDGKGVPGDGFNTANLCRDVSLLPTPVVNDMGEGKTVERWDEWTDDLKARHGNGNGHGKSLAIEAQRLLPTPEASLSGSSPDEHLSRKPGRTVVTALNIAAENPDHPAVRWGDYAPAIARWAHIVGRPAPSPTDDKARLSPEFVEWMMGWPDGHTAIAGASRSQRLKMCGNGVVPHQAVVAYRQLLARAETAMEAAA